MPLPFLAVAAIKAGVGAAGRLIAQRAATAAAKKAAEVAARKAAEAAAKRAAAQGLGRQAGTTMTRDAAKKAADASLKKSAKGPGNTVGKHKAKKKIKQKPHRDCGKVSKYSNAPKKLGKRNADHVPSGGALKAAAVDRLRRLNVLNKLTPKQRASILNSVYNNAQTITIPEDVHKAGRTYGNKNKPLIKGDSKDLKGAFKKDTKAIEKEMDKVDHGCSKKYKEAVKQLSKVDFDQYVKDAVENHKIVRSALGLP